MPGHATRLMPPQKRSCFCESDLSRVCILPELGIHVCLRDACRGAMDNTFVAEAIERGIAGCLLRTNTAIMYEANRIGGVSAVTIWP